MQRPPASATRTTAGRFNPYNFTTATWGCCLCVLRGYAIATPTSVRAGDSREDVAAASASVALLRARARVSIRARVRHDSISVPRRTRAHTWPPCIFGQPAGDRVLRCRVASWRRGSSCGIIFPQRSPAVFATGVVDAPVSTTAERAPRCSRAAAPDRAHGGRDPQSAARRRRTGRAVRTFVLARRTGAAPRASREIGALPRSCGAKRSCRSSSRRDQRGLVSGTPPHRCAARCLATPSGRARTACRAAP